MSKKTVYERERNRQRQVEAETDRGKETGRNTQILLTQREKRGEK